MKKNNTIKVNMFEKQLIISKSFARKAAIKGSPEYAALKDAKEMYLGYEIKQKQVKVNKSVERFKGLTYTYMEKYMDKYNTSASIREEYNNLRFTAECHSIKYPIIKKWFLSKFPEVENWAEIHKEPAAAAESVA